jgi:hypothetical protein
MNVYVKLMAHPTQRFCWEFVHCVLSVFSPAISHIESAKSLGELSRQRHLREERTQKDLAPLLDTSHWVLTEWEGGMCAQRKFRKAIADLTARRHTPCGNRAR